MAPDIAVAMAAAQLLWDKLMVLTPTKCPQAEQILLDQAHFWTLLNLLVCIEHSHWH